MSRLQGGQMDRGPIRVLHLVHKMMRGGIETWLMNVLRSIDRERFKFDFIVYTNEPSDYDEEVRDLGSRLLPCVPPTHPWAHNRDQQRILAQEGPFDAIHAHGSSVIGNALRLGAQAGIPVRIAHGHNTSEDPRRLRSYAYRALTDRWMAQYMTHGFGCSDAACDFLFGAGWRSDPRCRVLYYGMNWGEFEIPADTRALRAGLGLPQDALVVGHTGRFVSQKNHKLWVEVAAELARRREDVRFVLIGDGELRPAVEAEVQRLGLKGHFIFAGLRGDIPQVLQAMDVFFFPSLFEGLGLALVEAQAVGLPCVISDSIPGVATVVPAQVTALSPSEPVSRWADAVLAAAAQSREQNHLAAWQAVTQSRFSMDYCIEQLSAVYRGTPVGSVVGIRAAAALAASGGEG